RRRTILTRWVRIIRTRKLPPGSLRLQPNRPIPRRPFQSILSWNSSWPKMAGCGLKPIRSIAGRMALAALSPCDDSGSKLTAVRFWSLGDVTRVAIEVSTEFHYKSDRIENPDRLFFDIQGAKPQMVHKGTQVIPVGDSILKQIRVAETQPGVTRVVLDLD